MHIDLRVCRGVLLLFLFDLCLLAYFAHLFLMTISQYLINVQVFYIYIRYPIYINILTQDSRTRLYYTEDMVKLISWPRIWIANLAVLTCRLLKVALDYIIKCNMLCHKYLSIYILIHYIPQTKNINSINICITLSHER